MRTFGVFGLDLQGDRGGLRRIPAYCRYRQEAGLIVVMLGIE